MAQVSFEGLPDYSIPGGTIAGTLILETDGIVRATDLMLYLHGVETSQITIQAGKSTEAIVQKAPFLELVSSFHDALHSPRWNWGEPEEDSTSTKTECSSSTSSRPD
jgi:hypothetical protein